MSNANQKPVGMSINQLIAMLMAAQAQGATHAMVAVPNPPGQQGPLSAPVDWVSMAPVEHVAYIGLLDQFEDMSNSALESLDW